MSRYSHITSDLPLVLACLLSVQLLANGGVISWTMPEIMGQVVSSRRLTARSGVRAAWRLLDWTGLGHPF